MTIQFKNMGSSGMDLIKDETGLVWISITDSVFTKQMPLTNSDITNLISTLEYLRKLQPAGLFSDAFPSTSPNEIKITTGGTYAEMYAQLGYTNVSTYQSDHSDITSSQIGAVTTTNRL